MNFKRARTEQQYRTRYTDCLRTDGARDFSLLQNIQTDSQARPANYSGVPGLFPEVKRQDYVVGSCHHGMARPQVADRGTASDKDGSCE